MKKQIKRLSPHQNGKVFGILMALMTLPFMLPMFMMMSFAVPHMDHYMDGNELVGMGFPTIFMFIAPLIYLLIGYIFVAIWCLLYNFIQRFVGGFEFEVFDQEY